ncbi:N(G),N(G)-dimethylarginine dimethylaminohydrolase [Fodinibacter luteus]|uniref:N(G),N(G)-dimethylarginine dimethylaminohydrolase n=1 Tax=Fodinibacter luteus TaxID=552064 RepID=A0ABP8KBS2_9MICO
MAGVVTPPDAGSRPVALVRRPGPRLAEGLVTHVERSPVDVDRALEQWQAYAGALSDAGWEVVEVEPADDCPDAVFVEDAVVVHGDLAVLTRPGAPERRDEVAGVERAVRGLGLRVATIEAPGTLDGGDVLRTGGTAYVGVGGRTNGVGVQQLAVHLREFGVRVQAVPVTRALHLKSACTALPDGTVVGWGPVVDDKEAFPRYEDVPEEGGAHVVVVGEGHLLMATSAPRTAASFRSRGHEVTEVDIGELEKLEGCVTCLSVRVRGGGR